MQKREITNDEDTAESVSNVLLLYTLSESPTSSDVVLALQAYPGGYDNGSVAVLLLRSNLHSDLSSHFLSRISPRLDDLEIGENDSITIQVENNGYIYAGGIWQVEWSSDQQRYMLNCFCACNIDLVEVVDLLSAEEMELIEEAITQAEHFMKERFFSALFVSCREVGENVPEHSHQRPARERDTRAQEHTWLMIWNGFGIEPPPAGWYLSVSYNSQKPDAPFLVTLLQEWDA